MTEGSRQVGKREPIASTGQKSDERRAPRSLHPPAFGDLLRRYRVAAGLTQEELAARATLSARAIGDIERGVKQRPQRETVRLLAEALGLTVDEQGAFAHAARTRQVIAHPLAPVVETPTNIPAVVTPLIGRDEELAAIPALLRGRDVRLVTITGFGGIGKTRLSLAIADSLVPDFPDGVFFLPLASAREPGFVVATIAQALGIPESTGQPLRATLNAYLRTKHMLLVLDNFEQVIPAAVVVADLLASCPRLKALVTSRAPLHLRGEHEWVMEPLALPPTNATTMEQIAPAPAVELFRQRAVAVQRRFALTETNAGAVAAICAHLDGLPLAIELAAARVKILPPAVLLARLQQRLPLLTDGAHDLPAHQQSMRETIGWSYELLADDEQQLFRQLSVFVGGFTLEAAEAIAAPPEDPRPVLNGLTSLINSSLAHAEARDDEARYRMLEVVREYAWERLEMSGERGSTQRVHAAYFREIAEQAEPHLTGAEQASWFDRLEGEHDNLRAALRWVESEGEIATGLRIAGALWRFWLTQGHLSEGRTWVEALLARVDAADRAGMSTAWAKALYGASVLATEQGDYARATALIGDNVTLLQEFGERRIAAALANILGNIANYQGEYERARAHYEESRVLFQAIGNVQGATVALNNLGIIARTQGDFSQAMQLFEESLATKRTMGDKRGMGVALINLSDVARDMGEYDRAIAYIEESIALYRELGEKPGLAYALNNMGDVARDRGDVAHATVRYEESLALFRDQGDQASIALVLRNLGQVARIAGEYERAIALVAESLTLSHTVGNLLSVTQCLEALAYISVARRPSRHAARLLGAAATFRDSIGAPMPPADRAAHEQFLAAEAALGAGAFAAAWHAGQALSVEQAVQEALAASSPDAPPE
jgi:predicted ATPase/transcriptional regulator with XRE-family HTH domain